MIDDSTIRVRRPERRIVRREIGNMTYSVDEVAAMLGKSTNYVYAALRAGELPGVRVGGSWIIPIAGFNDWLNGGYRNAKQEDDGYADIGAGV